MEEWKNIEGYDGLYKVSNLGRVKSLGNGNSNNSKEKLLKPIKRKGGYLAVSLYKEGKLKKFSVHRLVAQSFIENPNNFNEVNHKDENKVNNSVNNLEWCDRKYNCNFGKRNERSALNRTNHPTISKKVLCIETGKIFQSINEAERQTGIKQSSISKCCLGKRKTAGGFHWKFV